MVLANVWFPDPAQRKMIVAAVCTSAGGAGAAITITIPNGYPPIDISIPCPVVAMMSVLDANILAIDDNDGYALGGQCGTAVAPTGAGEFRILTGRTIEIWEITARAKHVLVVYVSKGSGQET